LLGEVEGLLILRPIAATAQPEVSVFVRRVKLLHYVLVRCHAPNQLRSMDRFEEEDLRRSEWSVRNISPLRYSDEIGFCIRIMYEFLAKI